MFHLPPLYIGMDNAATLREQRCIHHTPEQPMREDAPQQIQSIEARNHEDRIQELWQQITALDEQIRVLQHGPYTPRCQPGRPMEPPPAIQRHMASAPRAAQQEARRTYASPMPIRRGIRGIIDRRRARRRVSHFAPSSLQRTQFSEAQRSSLPSQRVDDVPRANNVRGSGMSSPDAYQRSEASHSSATASRGAAGADRETIAPKRVTFDGMNKSFQEQLKNNLDFVRGYFPISFLKDGKYEKLNTVEDLRNPEFQAYFPDISRIINLLVLTIQHRDFLPRQGEWLRSGTLAAVNIERQGDVTHMILRRDNLLSQPIKIDKATTPEQGIKALQEIGMSIDRQKVRGVELDLVGTDERFPKGLLASEYQILKQFNILQILPEVCSGTKVLASLARHYKDAAIDASLVRERARVSQECFYRHMIGTTSVIVITKKFFEEKKFLDRAVMKQLEEEMKKSSEKRQEVASPAGSNETTVTSAVNVGSERDIQGSTETVKEVPASTLAVIYSGGMNIGIQNRYLANNMRTAIRNFTESDRPCFSFYSISQARVMREHHLFSRKIAKNNEEYDAQKKKIKNLIDTLAGGPSELREPKNFHVWLDSLKKAMQLSTRITLVTGAKDIQDTEGDDEYLTKLKEYVNECKNKNIDLSAIVIVKNLQEAQRPTKRITDLISNGMTVHMVYVKDGASEDPENDIQNLREKQLQQLMDGQQPSTEDSGLGIMTYEPTKNEAKKEELSQKQENENKAIPSLASSSQ